MDDRIASGTNFWLESVHMQTRLKRMAVEAAKEDLQTRTLGPIGYDFGRLMYLSSLRDFSTGEYHHYGLARSFSQTVATAALSASHIDIFYRLTLSSLATFVEQTERFIHSSATDLDFHKTVAAWETLEAYRVAIPTACDQLTAALFRSNVKVAVALAKSRRPNRQEQERFALRFP